MFAPSEEQALSDTYYTASWLILPEVGLWLSVIMFRGDNLSINNNQNEDIIKTFCVPDKFIPQTTDGTNLKRKQSMQSLRAKTNREGHTISGVAHTLLGWG